MWQVIIPNQDARIRELIARNFRSTYFPRNFKYKKEALHLIEQGEKCGIPMILQKKEMTP